MRCQSCNKLLNDFEATRKHAHTGAYLDLCNRCFGDVKYTIPVVERDDLAQEESIVEESIEEYEYNKEEDM